MLKDFKAFIMKGNVLDLAVAVIIGAAFGAIVTSGVAPAAISCAQPLPNPNPPTAISNVHRHTAPNFAIPLTYAVRPRRCNTTPARSSAIAHSPPTAHRRIVAL